MKSVRSSWKPTFGLKFLMGREILALNAFINDFQANLSTVLAVNFMISLQISCIQSFQIL